MIYGWSPGVGDPTVWGWLTVANYIIAFYLVARASRNDWRNANFWICISALMLVLCINKQLDLQSLLTEIGRKLAYRYDWYQDRRYFQGLFIKTITVMLFIIISIAFIVMRKSQKTIIGAMIGMTLLASFVAARAASFHHMDHTLTITFTALKLHHILENIGIFLVSINAALAVSPARRGKRER